MDSDLSREISLFLPHVYWKQASADLCDLVKVQNR